MPTDVIDRLNDLAAERDMSLQALVRLYVGQGMRVDISRRWAERGGGGAAPEPPPSDPTV